MERQQDTANSQLQRRLSFLAMDEEAAAFLSRHSERVIAALPASLDAFYAQVRDFPEVSRFFANDALLEHARTAQHTHWQNIASGRFDTAYLESVTRIGRIHARIGLEPRWYIGGYALILGQLQSQLLGSVPSPWRSLFGRGGGFGRRDAARLVALLTKAAMLDMDIVVSIYLATLDEQRAAAEAKQAASAAATTEVAAALGHALERLAGGDLAHRLEQAFTSEYEELRANYNAALAKLQALVDGIVSATSGIHSNIGEIAQGSDDLSKRTEQQAASLEETAAALDQITTRVRRAAEGAQHAREIVTQTRASAEQSGHVVHQAIAAMGEIERSSTQISRIISVIDDIAFQTNLLALNAGVEAARAGDAGRGFAVVASEVRALAQRSAEAAREIKQLISASTQQVGSGVTLVGNTGEVLSRIVVQVGEITSAVDEIAASAQEQVTGLAEVNAAIDHIDKMTQQNAAMVQQSTAAVQSLTTDTDNLVHLTGRFDLGASSAAHGTSVPSALPVPGVGRSDVSRSAAAAASRANSAVSTRPRRVARASGGGGAAALAVARDEGGWEEF